MNLSDTARAEIARLIAAGFTSGLLDGEDGRIAWSLDYRLPDSHACSEDGEACRG